MAMPALNLRESRVKRLFHDYSSSHRSSQYHRAHGSLFFPPNVIGMRTPFRDKVLNYIFCTAQDLSEGRMRFASVSVSSQPDEEDSLTLDLTLTVDADWEFIKKLRYDILVKVGEWSKEWPETDRDDYGRRIYFGIIPSVL